MIQRERQPSRKVLNFVRERFDKLLCAQLGELNGLLIAELDAGPPLPIWCKVDACIAEYMGSHARMESSTKKTEMGFYALSSLISGTALLRLALVDRPYRDEVVSAAIIAAWRELGRADACMEIASQHVQRAKKGGVKDNTRTSRARALLKTSPQTSIADLSTKFHLDTRHLRRLKKEVST